MATYVLVYKVYVIWRHPWPAFKCLLHSIEIKIVELYV